MWLSLVDSAMTRDVLRDISKRPVDISDLHVNVMHGVVYLRGKLDKLRGYYGDIDIREELNVITRVIRQKQGVRDVVCDVQCGGLTVAERLQDRKRHSGYYA